MDIMIFDVVIEFEDGKMDPTYGCGGTADVKGIIDYAENTSGKKVKSIFIQKK